MSLIEDKTALGPHKPDLGGENPEDLRKPTQLCFFLFYGVSLCSHVFRVSVLMFFFVILSDCFYVVFV